MGPAPPVAEIRSAVRAALPGIGRVLVACSGGADSLALAAAVAFEAPRIGVRAGLVTVDHGLQDGSAELAARVAAIGYELGLDPVEVVRVEVVRVGVGAVGGPEAAARTARYSALDSAAVALDASVLLGHTLDDQAETVLLGLGRGSGPRSIAAMAGSDGRYLRPLLGVRRATTSAACAALGLPVWDDPHNIDSAFMRVRLRREVLPLLEEVLQGGVAESLARTASLLGDDLAALDIWAGSVFAAFPPDVVEIRPEIEPRQVGRREIRLPVTGLAELPRAVRTRVLRRWVATACPGPLTAERTAALDALVTDWHGQGTIDLPGGASVRRVSARLVLSAAMAQEKSPEESQENRV